MAVFTTTPPGSQYFDAPEYVTDTRHKLALKLLGYNAQGQQNTFGKISSWLIPGHAVVANRVAKKIAKESGARDAAGNIQDDLENRIAKVMTMIGVGQTVAGAATGNPQMIQGGIKNTTQSIGGLMAAGSGADMSNDSSSQYYKKGGKIMKPKKMKRYELGGLIEDIDMIDKRTGKKVGEVSYGERIFDKTANKKMLSFYEKKDSEGLGKYILKELSTHPDMKGRAAFAFAGGGEIKDGDPKESGYLYLGKKGGKSIFYRKDDNEIIDENGASVEGEVKKGGNGKLYVKGFDDNRKWVRVDDGMIVRFVNSDNKEVEEAPTRYYTNKQAKDKGIIKPAIKNAANDAFNGAKAGEGANGGAEKSTFIPIGKLLTGVNIGYFYDTKTKKLYSSTNSGALEESLLDVTKADNGDLIIELGNGKKRTIRSNKDGSYTIYGEATEGGNIKSQRVKALSEKEAIDIRTRNKGLNDAADLAATKTAEEIINKSAAGEVLTSKEREAMDAHISKTMGIDSDNTTETPKTTPTTKTPSTTAKNASTTTKTAGGKSASGKGKIYAPPTELKDGQGVKEFQQWAKDKGYEAELGKPGVDGKYGDFTKSAWEKHKEEYLKDRAGKTTTATTAITTNPELSTTTPQIATTMPMESTTITVPELSTTTPQIATTTPFENSKKPEFDVGTATEIGMDLGRVLIGAIGASKDLPEYEVPDAWKKYVNKIRQMQNEGLSPEERAYANNNLLRNYAYGIQSIRNATGGSGSTGAVLGALVGLGGNMQDAALKVLNADVEKRSQNLSNYGKVLEQDMNLDMAQYQQSYNEALQSRNAFAQLAHSGVQQMTDRMQYEKTYGKGSKYDQLMDAYIDRTKETKTSIDSPSALNTLQDKTISQFDIENSGFTEAQKMQLRKAMGMERQPLQPPTTLTTTLPPIALPQVTTTLPQIPLPPPY